MSRIELLDHKTIDSIAAGEVVERPASAAKELVENAIDAGSTVITVEIKNGGKSLLRVTDNGCGIPYEQVRLAFMRHATSKLRDIEDLKTISSLGFRGEALSSIGAVSKVEMITRTPDEIAGTRYRMNGGEEEKIEQIGAPFGTTVIMRDLFYNTPAREKFLRSAVSEGSAVASIIEQLALSHPEISFTLLSDGRQKIYTSGSGDMLECAYRLYGREITNSLLPVDSQTELLGVSGYIGLPILSRGNRNFENYYINGRYVRDKILSAAIEDAYQGHLMQHRYPFTLLDITIDKEKVDVNVHPAKSEVRFSDKEKIYEELKKVISEVLSLREEVPAAFGFGEKLRKGRREPAASFARSGDTDRPAAVSNEIQNGQKVPQASAVQLKDNTEFPADVKRNSPGSPADAKQDGTRNLEKEIRGKEEKHPQAFESARISKEKSERPEAKEVPELVHEKQLSLFDDAKLGEKEPFRIIGQVFATFILIEYKESFYIIDQHAAHEKVMYEKFMKTVAERKPSTQYLMPAVLLTLTAAENDLFAGNLEIFTELGFEIEHFQGREWRITGMPADLFIQEPAEFFKDLLDELSGMGRPGGNLKDIIASKACKAAVKGNTRFSDTELHALIEDLLKLEDPYHCPHGRPVMISMTHYELDKRFKRIV